MVKYFPREEKTKVDHFFLASHFLVHLLKSSIPSHTENAKQTKNQDLFSYFTSVTTVPLCGGHHSRCNRMRVNGFGTTSNKQKNTTANVEHKALSYNY